MIFKFYVKDVFGRPLNYPADEESRHIANMLRKGKTTLDGEDLGTLKFFGVQVEEVLRSEAK